MAFRKTAGRSNLVQPSGIPDFSGFKQAASTFNQIGELAYGIGLDDRKRQYNQLIRQAEIDGKTAGVVYDEEGKLVPLTNLDYAKAAETFAESDKQAILQTYKKAAVQTYVNAAANDINDAASKALIDNPDDPSAIRSSASGYLSGISDLDPEIYTALAPKVAAAFQTAENQALAKQQDEARNYAVQQAEKAFAKNAFDLGVLGAKSAGTDDVKQKAIDVRSREILDEQDDIIETLRANGYSESQISTLLDGQATAIASKTAQAAVERAYYSGGVDSAYVYIKQAFEEAEDNPDVNQEVLRQVLTQSVSMLSAIDKASSDEEKEMRTGIYNNFYRQIVIDGLDIVSEMSNPSSEIHMLEGTQLGTLWSVGTSLKEQTESKAKSIRESQIKGYISQYNNLVSVFENPKETSPAMAMDAMKQIILLHGMGNLGAEDEKLLLDAKSKFREAMNAYAAEGASKEGSLLSMELNQNLSSFSKKPSDFLNEMYMSDLESKGIIGKGGFWASRDSFITDVGTYAGHYKKRVDLMRLAGTAERKVLNTIMPSQKELEALSQVMGFDKIRNLATGEFVEMDLLSDDETVFQSSVDNVAAFAVQSKGLLHPKAKFLFDAASNNVENADRALRVMGQTISAIRSARDIDGVQAEGIFLSSMNEDTTAFLRIASDVGIENAVNAFSADRSINMNRNASSIVANTKYADQPEDKALDQFFMDTYNESLEAKSFFRFLQPYITDADNQMLYQMATSAGETNVEGMILRDPEIKQAMKSIFLGKMLKYPQYNPVEAMRDTIRQIGTRVGAQRNAYSGNLEFVTNPILPRAQATVGNAGITLGMDDIDRDIKDLFFNNPGIISTEISDELARAGKPPMVGSGDPTRYLDSALHYIPNENYGGLQTYTVVLRTSAGKAIPLLNNYSYDFKRSKGYESFLKSVESLKSDRMKNFWSSYGLMDQSLLQSGFDSLERTRSDSSFDSLFNLYNSTFRADIGDEPLSPEEKDEFFYMIERITSLGWR